MEELEEDKRIRRQWGGKQDNVLSLASEVGTREQAREGSGCESKHRHPSLLSKAQRQFHYYPELKAGLQDQTMQVVCNMNTIVSLLLKTRLCSWKQKDIMLFSTGVTTLGLDTCNKRGNWVLRVLSCW